MDAVEILTRLIASPPWSLRALEAVIGAMPYADSIPLGLKGSHTRSTPSELVAEVAATFAPIDFHHQDPFTAIPSMRASRVLVRGAAAECERLLLDRFGPPTRYVRGATPVLAFGMFYLSYAGDDADLAWCVSPPGFARVAAVELDRRLRAEFIRSLPTSVSALLSVGAADAFRHRLSPGCGIVTERRHSQESWALLFLPAVTALEVCGGFGWSDSIAISIDVHQSRWRILSPDGDTPLVGLWRVRAELAERPEGELPKETFGASPLYTIANHAAKVSRLQFDATTPAAFDVAPTTPLDACLSHEHPFETPTPFPSFGSVLALPGLSR